MASPVVRLMLAASLILLAVPAMAQTATACAPRDIASLSSAQVALLKRASLDPIVGCPA